MNNKLKSTELFIDNRFVISKTNITVKVSRPVKIIKVLEVDKIWEASGVDFSSVIKESDGYRMYYQCHDQNANRIWCLAYSKDGLTWEKPVLGIVDYKGSKENNIVSMDVYEVGNIFKRYKNGKSQFVTLAMKSDFKHYFFVSDDGIRFAYETAPVMPYCADSQNQIIYDQNKNKYVWYLRSWYFDSTLNDYYRTVSYYECNYPSEIQFKRLSTDSPIPMYRWGKDMPPAINNELKRSMILNYKNTENKNKDLYSSAVMPYGKTYFAFPSVYTKFENTKIENDGVLDVHLYYGSNGIDWTDLGVYVNKDIFAGFNQYYMMNGAVLKNDTIYNYILAEKSTHGVWRTKSAIYAVQQDISRYISLSNLTNSNAVIIAKGIKTDYANLFLNFKTEKGGFVKVQLIGKTGKVINQTSQLSGDFTYKQIKWLSRLSDKNGNDVDRISFTVYNASLFALTHK